MERLVDGFFDVMPHRVVAWLLVLMALACGAIGLVAGLAQKSLRLGAVGWFTGGSTVALIGVLVLLDLLVRQRGEGGVHH